MSEWVNLDVVDGVGPVALKRRRPQEDSALLDHEAAVLSAVEHPGIVRLVERRGGPDPALVTHFIGTHSLATALVSDVDDAITIIASLADTVADLHRLGVRHGALDPSHVLLGPGRRPVLCGFSKATPPGTPVDESPTPAEDVAALGRLMTRLLAGHDDLEPIPSRRSRRGRAWVGYRQRALLTLADHCQADEPSARPSAGSLAATIGDLVESERSPKRALSGAWADRLGSIPSRARELASWSRPHLGPLNRRRTLAVALAATGLVAAGIAARSLRPSPTDASAAASASPETPAAPATDGMLDRDPAVGGSSGSPPTSVSVATTAAGTVTTTTGATEEPCPAATPTKGADTDGDGCPDGRAVVVDHIVTVDEERFVLGRPGDWVLVGDWDCDGLSTAVLVRSHPPALWHFPAWAPVGEMIAAQLVSDDVDPATVTSRPYDRGCDALIATNALSGDSTPLAVTP
jgi:hypothetical protein